MQKHQVPEKTPEDLLLGGLIVPSCHANAIAFIPKQYAEESSKSGARLSSSLPLAIFKSHSASKFYMDWGCKIRSDGTYHLSFSGEEYYIEFLGISKNRQIMLATREVVQAEQWIPTIENL